MNASFVKAGLLVLRDNHILLCRKRGGVGLLILPGGRVEPGESPTECLRRELREELGNVQACSVEFVATYTSPAAGLPGKIVEILLYQGDLVGEPAPHAEIEALVWFGPKDDRAVLAPSIREPIIPDLIRRGILPW